MEGVHSFVLRKACTLCRQAHVGCDGGQPCRRCATSGQGDQCVFLPSRKRGRPHKSSVPSTSGVPALHFLVPSTGHHQTTPAAKLQRVAGSQPMPQTSSSPPPLPIRPALPQSAPSAGPMAPIVAVPRTLSTSTVPTRTTQQQQHHRPGNELNLAARGSVMVSEQEPNQGSLLSLLFEQLQEMRRENQYLHEGMHKLNSRQKKFKRKIYSLEEENRRLVSLVCARHESATLHTRISQTPFSQPIDPSPYGTGSSLPPRLRAIQHLLPFLEEYDLLAADVAIDDVSKPFAAFVAVEDKDAWPTFIYASPSYSRLFGYEQIELIGTEFEPLCHPLDQVTCDVVLYYSEQRRTPVGPVFHTTPTMLTKNRRTMRLMARYQYFFSQRGQVKWFINTIDVILPTDAEESTMQSPESSLSLTSAQTSPTPDALVSPTRGFTQGTDQHSSPSVTAAATPCGWDVVDWTLAAPQADSNLAQTDDLEELLSALHEPSLFE